MSPKKRPILITVANIFFIGVYSLYGLIAYAVCFLSAYFGAIAIYNDRKKNAKKRRRFILAANSVIACAAFICFAHDSALLSKNTLGIYLFGAAAIAMHSVSYVVDVYRGDCEPQTAIAPLSAYIGFFPSADFGPILKYKSFRKSFCAPQISHEKLASGIRLYVFGLAESLLIADRLQTLLSLADTSTYENLGEMPVLLYTLIYLTHFCMKIIGSVHMGLGISRMMGFYVRPAFVRKISIYGAAQHLKCFNSLLNSWIKDYIMNPLAKYVSPYAAVVAAVLCGAAYYGFSSAAFAAAAVVLLLMLIEKATAPLQKKLPIAVKCVLSKILLLLAAVAVCLPKLLANLTKVPLADAAYISSAAVKTEALTYLLPASWLPLAAGLILMCGVVSSPIRRISQTWLHTVLPITELLLIMLCTAFLIGNG